MLKSFILAVRFFTDEGSSSNRETVIESLSLPRIVVGIFELKESFQKPFCDFPLIYSSRQCIRSGIESLRRIKARHSLKFI